MKDTELNDRQIRILECLGVRPLKREEISGLLEEGERVSKITLIRDLGRLVNSGLVVSEGRGRGTTYRSIQKPTLRIINPDNYFAEGSYLRKSSKNKFDDKIFNNLEDLFSATEEKDLAGKLKKFNEREKDLDPTIFRRELERFTVEFSWKSSKIEGNTYTLLETEALIKHAEEASGHSKYEAIMLLNHKRAIDFILENRALYKTLTLEKVQNLQGILTAGLEVTQGIRNGKVEITGTGYIPLSGRKEIEKALRKTIRAINDVSFSLEKALIASSMIAYIQPFYDGNKRTARTLANALLLSNNYYPLSYRDLKEIDYIKSMIIFYEQGSLHGLKKILLGQLWFSQENYFAK